MKVAVMTSGGMDSTVLLYDLIQQGYECLPLFFNYGQKCSDTEFETLLKVLPPECCEGVSTIDLSDIYAGSQSLMVRPVDAWAEDLNSDDLYLPYRNILLLSAAAAWAHSNGIRGIYAAFINSNHAKEIDCSARFLAEAESIFENYGGVTLQMPYKEMSKLEVAKLGIRLRAPIGETFSCQLFEKIPCGACPNCVDRLDALAELDQ